MITVSHPSSNRPSGSPPPLDLGEFNQVLKRANELFRERRLGEAANLYQRLTAVPEYQAEAYYGLAMVSAATNDGEAAEERLLRTVQFDNHHHRAMLALGQIAYSKRDLAQALRWFQIAKDQGNQKAAVILQRLEERDPQAAQSGQGAPPPPPESPADYPVQQPASLTQGGIPSPLRGSIQHFVSRQEPRGRGNPPVIVWLFRLGMKIDHQAQVAQVEMKGLPRHFKSTIRDGDVVTVHGRWNRSGVFAAHRAYNHTTRSKIFGQTSHGVLVAMAIVAVLIAVVIALAA